MNFPYNTSVRCARPSVLGPQRYALFLSLQIFLQLFFKVFLLQNLNHLIINNFHLKKIFKHYLTKSVKGLVIPTGRVKTVTDD